MSVMMTGSVMVTVPMMMAMIVRMMTASMPCMSNGMLMLLRLLLAVLAMFMFAMLIAMFMVVRLLLLVVLMMPVAAVVLTAWGDAAACALAEMMVMVKHMEFLPAQIVHYRSRYRKALPEASFIG